MTRRAGVLMAAVLALAATVTTGGSSWAEAPSGEVSWVSAGDSYSSGEGVAGNRGACAQSRLAYGPLAGQLARRAGWDITAEAFTACTGHLIEDLFNQRPDNRNAALWDWGVEQGAPERVDLLTFSFGGNDIGFADLLIDCLPLPDGVSFDDVVTDDTLDITGCDTPEQEINDRIAALLDPPRRDCEGGRQGSDADYDCDLLIDDLGDSDPDNDVRGTLVDFYVYLANEHLTERGHIVVVGYPNLFAPVEEWPGYVKIQCQGVSRGDTERLGRLAANLDNTMIQAVRAANEQLGRDRIHYLPRSIIYRGGSHELCGSGDDWLNGLDFDRGDGQFRRENAFHPNDAGHAATAQALIELLEPISFDADAPSVAPASADLCDLVEEYIFSGIGSTFLIALQDSGLAGISPWIDGPLVAGAPMAVFLGSASGESLLRYDVGPDGVTGPEFLGGGPDGASFPDPDLPGPEFTLDVGNNGYSVIDSAGQTMCNRRLGG